MFPALEIDEIAGGCFSESPGIRDGAAGVDGVAMKGEFADCRGVPAFGRVDSKFCWSICGDEC